MTTRRTAAIVLAAALLVQVGSVLRANSRAVQRPALGGIPSSAAPDREAAWRADLDDFARAFAAAQVDFTTLYPRDYFDAELAAITKAIPTSTDADIVLALMRLVASARVAHTTVRIPTAPSPITFHRLPLTFAWHSDGLAITARASPIETPSASAWSRSAG